MGRVGITTWRWAARAPLTLLALGAVAGCGAILGLHDKSVGEGDGGADALAVDAPGAESVAGDAGGDAALADASDATVESAGADGPVEAGADGADDSPRDGAGEGGDGGKVDASEGGADADAGTCGNGVVDPGEACDPSVPDGGAPPTCPLLFGHGATGTTSCVSCALDDSDCALPQLQAGAPWPMFGRTLTHSSRSSAHGPHTQPAGKQIKTIFAAKTGNMLYTTPAIGADGTVYQPVVDYNNGPDAGLWVHRRGAPAVTSVTFPLSAADTPDCGLTGGVAVAADGTVYAQTGSGWLYVYSPPVDGGATTVTSLQVSTSSMEQNCLGGLTGGPAIDVDGTVYLTFADALYRYVPSMGASSQVWTCDAHYPAVIGADGNVVWEGYYGNAVLCAYDPSSNTAVFTKGLTYSSTAAPTLTNDGRTLLPQSYSPGGLYVYTPPLAQGQKGAVLLGGAVIGLGPAVASDGTIIASALDGTVFALSGRATAHATPLWKTALGLDTQSTPLVDADGYSYVIGSNATVYAVDPTGHLVWTVTLTGGEAYYNAAMDSDGTLYVGTEQTVYAITP